MSTEHRTLNTEHYPAHGLCPRVVAFTKDWDDVPTCTTHVLREMAKTMPVLWISSIGTRKPSLGHSGDFGRALKRLIRALRPAEHKETNLRVLSPLLIPKAQSATVRRLNRMLFAVQTWRDLRSMGKGPIEYWCFVPNAVDLLPGGEGEGAGEKVFSVQCSVFRKADGTELDEKGQGEEAGEKVFSVQCSVFRKTDGTEPDEKGQGEEPTANIERRTSNIEHRTGDQEPRTTNYEPRTSNIEHPTSNIQHPTSNIQQDYRQPTTDNKELPGTDGAQQESGNAGSEFAGVSECPNLRINECTNARMHESSNQQILESTNSRVSELPNPALVVYYCVDDWSKFENLDTEWIEEKERQMIRRADVVFTPSRFLAEKCGGERPCFPPEADPPLADAKQASQGRPFTPQTSRRRLSHFSSTIHYSPFTIHSPPVYHVPHGVQYEMFAAALGETTKAPADIADLPGPVIGFYGNIYPWIDFKLVAELAKAKPNWSFVMIGQVYCDVSAIACLPNVFLLGRREHAALPGYCKGFAAAMIPYDMTNPRMQSVNPVKLLELLAAGVPVVSARLPDVVGLMDRGQATADERRCTQMADGRWQENAEGGNPKPARDKAENKDDVIMCETPEEWVAALEKQVARTDRREISRRAGGNDWRDRVSMMREVIDGIRKQD